MTEELAKPVADELHTFTLCGTVLPIMEFHSTVSERPGYETLFNRYGVSGNGNLGLNARPDLIADLIYSPAVGRRFVVRVQRPIAKRFFSPRTYILPSESAGVAIRRSPIGLAPSN